MEAENPIKETAGEHDLAFDEHDRPSAEIINDCVHCGFCLPTCPTYVETKNELDSPRGRIHLIKNAVEGKIPLDGSLVKHLDLCLGCLACETACPSGVKYSSLIETSRSQIERRYDRPGSENFIRSLIFSIFPYPLRLKLLLPFLLAQKYLGINFLLNKTGLINILPRVLRNFIKLAPDVDASAAFSGLPSFAQAAALARYKVILLRGCVQSVFFPKVNKASVNVLSKLGCNVEIPKKQGCCGALSLHSGRMDEARKFARRLIDEFSKYEAQYIIVNSAGCGSSMKGYSELLKDDPQYKNKAKEFSSKIKDIMEFIHEIGLDMELNEINKTVTYQDACHVAHGQGITLEPREFLHKIPGINFTELNESDMCCGSAGIYNLVQPDMSEKLLNRKVLNIKEIKPDVLVASNPGCLLQITSGLKKEGVKIETAHPIELIDQAIK
ncbi:MAG: 4Fe-4S dicluster domain-containing protein [Candidatus Dadabacteria bacterium]|nr:4Fe-4S dicluster domain-containing protein [Candidatus Dadabacteria bacterium]NIS08537.1 4Fe-4S dicluster domain-containing protein [Candidatus Dadabacteria bacterium]NIV41365.1 4Fe-4S dicluster domain-containing protein [Candidatus Dadabacteria bacterium]NIX14572.1 4Fe-4S dicluster domain-containing protein [Candidatus Dadabacteria bacterium]NIY21027.1 4Fe-4S dicluster domain-containing protein [Candidatus Dadabacteria bacterium]